MLGTATCRYRDVALCPQAVVLALVTVTTVPLLRALGRRLLSMADADGAAFVPGSLVAAFVTCPNQGVAKELARAMVEKKLAACVNILPHVTSVYEWKGKLEEDSEVLLMIKTRSSKVPALAEFVRSSHPYEVPEVVAVPVVGGNAPYLRWVQDAVPE